MEDLASKGTSLFLSAMDLIMEVKHIDFVIQEYITYMHSTSVVFIRVFITIWNVLSPLDKEVVFLREN